MRGRSSGRRENWSELPGVAPVAGPRTEREAYELMFTGRPEADVSQFAAYQDLIHTLGESLEVNSQGLWVAWDTACYWVPGNNQAYLVPSVFVAAGGRPELPTQSYRRWEHGPLLLVAEVSSRRSRTPARGPHLKQFAEGLVPYEYLFFDPARDELRLHRRQGDTYPEVAADENGWVFSEQLLVWFGVEGHGRLRAYDRERNLLQTRAEAERRRQEEARKAAVASVRQQQQARMDALLAERRAEVTARLASLENEVTRRRTVAQIAPVSGAAASLRLPGNANNEDTGTGGRG
ncbi:MAG: hypothetical protein FJX77_03770 [Armatimonadetes bacterium]|nr:hypothetical protein [Armatimonadota bacterium]